MANETLLITNLCNSEIIDPLIALYAIDNMVIAETARLADVEGKGSKTWTFEKWSKNSAAAVSEFGTISNSQLTTSEVSVTAAKVAVLRHVTEEAWNGTILGQAGLQAFIVEDFGLLLAEKMDSDLAALFSSATVSSSHTGMDFSVFFFLEMVTKLRIAKAKGPFVCVTHPLNAGDLQQSIAASTGSVFNNPNVQGVLNGQADNGDLGPVFNIPVRYTSLVPTANGGADNVTGMYCDARGNKRQAALGLVNWWGPKTKVVGEAQTVSDRIAGHTAYGAGLINTDTICKGIFGAT